MKSNGYISAPEALGVLGQKPYGNMVERLKRVGLTPVMATKIGRGTVAFYEREVVEEARVKHAQRPPKRPKHSRGVWSASIAQRFDALDHQLAQISERVAELSAGQEAIASDLVRFVSRVVSRDAVEEEERQGG